MFILRTYVDVGGLMSYGVDIDASFRRVANFVAKILNGAQPGDLPVEQPVEGLPSIGVQILAMLCEGSSIGIVVVAAYAASAAAPPPVVFDGFAGLRRRRRGDESAGKKRREGEETYGEGLQDAPHRLFPSSLTLPAIGQNTRGLGD